MQKSEIKRVFLIVLDSFGCGATPDAADFDVAATYSTLRSVTESGLFPAANLTRLGLYNIDGVGTGTPAVAPIGAHARRAAMTSPSTQRGDTMLDALSRTKYDVIGVGKIADIFGTQLTTEAESFLPRILKFYGSVDAEDRHER